MVVSKQYRWREYDPDTGESALFIFKSLTQEERRNIQNGLYELDHAGMREYLKGLAAPLKDDFVSASELETETPEYQQAVDAIKKAFGDDRDGLAKALQYVNVPLMRVHKRMQQSYVSAIDKLSIEQFGKVALVKEIPGYLIQKFNDWILDVEGLDVQSPVDGRLIPLGKTFPGVVKEMSEAEKAAWLAEYPSLNWVDMIEDDLKYRVMRKAFFDDHLKWFASFLAHCGLDFNKLLKDVTARARLQSLELMTNQPLASS